MIIIIIIIIIIITIIFNIYLYGANLFTILNLQNAKMYTI